MRRAAFPRCKTTESLKKMFYFNCVIFGPSPSIKAGNVFEVFDSVCVPSSKSLDNKGLEKYALRMAIVEVCAVFGRLPHLDCGGSGVSGTVEDCDLGGRDNANIERHLPPIDPVVDVDVCWTRLGGWDKAGQFIIGFRDACCASLKMLSRIRS